MGNTSDIIDEALGGVRQYRELLAEAAENLADRFPDPDVRPVLRSIPEKAIGLVPMVLCDRLAADLGVAAPRSLLQALGVLCFHISTHDDVVDEPPSSRRGVGSLLYAGDISALEGLCLLQWVGRPKVTDAVVTTIAANHAAQQKGLRDLWEQCPTSFEEYRRGLEHSTEFVAIGVNAALALANRRDLEPRLRAFCAAYGLAFQLVDDLLEVAADRGTGYHSFPVVEGSPYFESRRQLAAALAAARASLDPVWDQTVNLVSQLERVAHRVVQTDAVSA